MKIKPERYTWGDVITIFGILAMLASAVYFLSWESNYIWGLFALAMHFIIQADWRLGRRLRKIEKELSIESG